MRAEQTSFLFGANAPFIEELYARYLGDPNTVDSEWRTFFEALAEQQGDVLAEVRGASWAPNGTRVIGAVDPETLPSPANRNVKGNGKANGAADLGQYIALLLGQSLEEDAPFGVDGVRVAEVARIELFDERGIGAEQE